MSLNEMRQGGGQYRNWPSPQITFKEQWKVKLRTDYPQLGDGFVVPHVYRPDASDDVYMFTVDAPYWLPEFDDWVVPGRSLLISGELFLDVKQAEYLEGYNPKSESFIGYRKPSRIQAHVRDEEIRIKEILTEGGQMQDGRQRFNHWAIVEYDGAEWRARFKVETSGLANGRYFRAAFNRRIDVLEFQPYTPPAKK